jgi:hypothetical protein
MTDKAVDLDQHRGMAAQKATELRRLLAQVAANERALRLTQDELEAQRRGSRLNLARGGRQSALPALRARGYSERTRPEE